MLGKLLMCSLNYDLEEEKKKSKFVIIIIKV